MRILFFLILLVIFCPGAFSQWTYDTASIAPAVRNGANAVRRAEDLSFEVSDIDRAVYKIHQVFTVLNRQGDSKLEFAEYTNRYLSLEDVEIKTFDHYGRQIAKYRKKDLMKFGDPDGLIQDGMYFYLHVPAPSYPITVEYNYQMKFTGTLGYPPYQISTPEEGVQQSSFTVKVPASVGLRYRLQKTKLDPEKTSDGQNIIYKWSVRNLAPVKAEPGGPAYQYCYPSVLLAPNYFQMYNTKGEMTSWKAFGAWEQSLINGLDVLPAERRDFFLRLTENAASEKEKIKLVYDYLQRNFRYVSIQLGIGGYKPFPAQFTDEKKYGDCKGLSFYMYSALRAIGIKSHVALVNAYYNREPVDPAFPMNQFNHMILCVPQKGDSIWLECTSKTCDFGVLGTFTENRNALLITEQGGVLVPTPKSKASSNIYNSVTAVDLNEDGTGKINTSLVLTGEYKELFNSVLASKKNDQKDFIVNRMGFKQPDQFEISEGKPGSGYSTEIRLDIEKIPQFLAGNKMFLNPRIYSLNAYKLPSGKERTQDFYFESPFEHTDTTVYNVPQGFSVDVMPEAVALKCDYAFYSTSYFYRRDKNQLVSTAKLVLEQNRIPASNYSNTKEFFDRVIGDNTQKFVIKKN